MDADEIVRKECFFANITIVDLQCSNKSGISNHYIIPRPMTSATRQHPLILFDGVCNLCQRSVQFVIRNDSAGRFQFASIQSDVAADILGNLHYDNDSLSSVLLLDDGQLYRKSRAALHIARQLNRPWPLLYYLFFWVPAIFSDWVYSYIGNRRYRWFGIKDECWIPDPEIASRFIDQGKRSG